MLQTHSDQGRYAHGQRRQQGQGRLRRLHGARSSPPTSLRWWLPCLPLPAGLPARPRPRHPAQRRSAPDEQSKKPSRLPPIGPADRAGAGPPTGAAPRPAASTQTAQPATQHHPVPGRHRPLPDLPSSSHATSDHSRATHRDPSRTAAPGRRPGVDPAGAEPGCPGSRARHRPRRLASAPAATRPRPRPANPPGAGTPRPRAGPTPGHGRHSAAKAKAALAQAYPGGQVPDPGRRSGAPATTKARSTELVNQIQAHQRQHRGPEPAWPRRPRSAALTGAPAQAAAGPGGGWSHGGPAGRSRRPSWPARPPSGLPTAEPDTVAAPAPPPATRRPPRPWAPAPSREPPARAGDRHRQPERPAPPPRTAWLPGGRHHPLAGEEPGQGRRTAASPGVPGPGPDRAQVEGTVVHAKVWASEASAVPVLQDHRASLETSLKAQGLTLGSFDLQHGRRERADAAAQPQDPAATAAAGRLAVVRDRAGNARSL